MAYRLFYTDESLAELESVLDFIQESSARAAGSFAAGLFEHVELLEAFPYLGSVVPRRARIRKLLHSPLRIYYSVDAQRQLITVIHFWHAARRDPELWVIMEQVTIVDRDNREVGIAPRPEMRAQSLPHRATYIFIFRPDGALLVQHRTLTKDVYPGYIDLCAGGVVTAGETYEQSAERELFEEMGIRCGRGGVELRTHFDFWFEEGRVWGRVFSCTWAGKLDDVVPQPEEVVRVEVMRPEQALSGGHAGPFTPDSLLALRRLTGELRS